MFFFLSEMNEINIQSYMIFSRHHLITGLFQTENIFRNRAFYCIEDEILKIQILIRGRERRIILVRPNELIQAAVN